MTTPKVKPPGKNDLLPTPELPCMYVQKEDAKGLVDHCILSMFYIVKDASQPDDDDAERTHWLLVWGGVNMWMDNNCCGSFSISASQVRVTPISPSSWTNPKDDSVHIPTGGRLDPRHMRDEDGNGLNSYNRISDPEKSPFVHVNTLLPGFPAMDCRQAQKWGRAVLLTNIIGLGSRWDRTLMRSVDMVNGHQEKVLGELLSLGNSQTRAICPVDVSKQVLSLHPFTRSGSREDENGIHILGSYGISYPTMMDMMYDWEKNHGEEVFNPNSGNEIRSTELLSTEADRYSGAAAFLPVSGMKGVNFDLMFRRFHAAVKTPWAIANLRRDSWAYAH